ncbi:MAG: hypothetical protein EAZ49_18165 [Oscillatoriales cyanobacterium]|nr:MAG: hypothetical protein EAZ49_18165 [Oscillatoriales cyanobacterium]
MYYDNPVGAGSPVFLIHIQGIYKPALPYSWDGGGFIFCVFDRQIVAWGRVYFTYLFLSNIVGEPAPTGLFFACLIVKSWRGGGFISPICFCQILLANPPLQSNRGVGAGLFWVFVCVK